MGRCFRRPWKQQKGPDAADTEGEPESLSPAASGEPGSKAEGCLGNRVKPAALSSRSS